MWKDFFYFTKTERQGIIVLVVSGYFKKDTTTTAADKMARVLEAEAAATQEPTYPA